MIRGPYFTEEETEVGVGDAAKGPEWCPVSLPQSKPGRLPFAAHSPSLAKSQSLWLGPRVPESCRLQRQVFWGNSRTASSQVCGRRLGLLPGPAHHLWSAS